MNQIEIVTKIEYYHDSSKFMSSLFGNISFLLKFIYSEKATVFCKIFPLLLTKKGKISQNFAAFSEYMNFSTAWTAKSDNFTLASSTGDKIGRFWRTWNLPELKGNCQFSFEEPARHLI
jgi:hypothetical protein